MINCGQVNSRTLILKIVEALLRYIVTRNSNFEFRSSALARLGVETKFIKDQPMLPGCKTINIHFAKNNVLPFIWPDFVTSRVRTPRSTRERPSKLEANDFEKVQLLLFHSFGWDVLQLH